VGLILLVLLFVLILQELASLSTCCGSSPLYCLPSGCSGSWSVAPKTAGIGWRGSRSLCRCADVPMCSLWESPLCLQLD
jgi:hypothetical protein